MIAWLTDTFIYTAALIALALLLRRPVARLFGPGFAYALWALPLLRFVMPPIVLPAELAPAPEAAAQAAVVIEVPVDALSDASLAAAAVPVAESGIAWGQWLVLAWLAGAVAFIVWRTWTYLDMRRTLLRDARPVGEVGKVRLVECPLVDAPIAFGVFDKVVALPLFFMASENRAARDLAIAHELAHHRGWDLHANMVAQPLLALHWFNPLAWIGWRAMRRDQEAACDARVVAARSAEDRAAYGRVIASFAAGPRLALAAPMACPVLGEKSIIHRLRSLRMEEISPRRRMAGRALLAGAALLLPLTASISYAEEAQPDVPDPPAPPAPPVPPAPGADGKVTKKVIIIETVDGDEAGQEGQPGVQTFTFRHDPHDQGEQGEQPDGQRRVEREVRVITRDGRTVTMIAPPAPPGAPVPPVPPMSWNGKDFDFDFDFDFDHDKFAQAFAGGHPNCDDDGGQVSESADGKVVRRFVLCRDATASAKAALERARAQIARDRSLDEDVRDEVIESLDREIEKLDRKDG